MQRGNSSEREKGNPSVAPEEPFVLRPIHRSPHQPIWLPTSAPKHPPSPSHPTPIPTSALLNPLWYPSNPRSKVLHVPPYLLFTYEYYRALYVLRSSSFLSLCSAPLRPLASSSSLVLPYPPDHFRGVSPRYLLASLLFFFFFSSHSSSSCFILPTHRHHLLLYSSPSQLPPQPPSLRRTKKKEHHRL